MPELGLGGLVLPRSLAAPAHRLTEGPLRFRHASSQDSSLRGPGGCPGSLGEARVPARLQECSEDSGLSWLCPGQEQGCFGLCWAVEEEGISPCEGWGSTSPVLSISSLYLVI